MNRVLSLSMLTALNLAAGCTQSSSPSESMSGPRGGNNMAMSAPFMPGVVGMSNANDQHTTPFGSRPRTDDASTSSNTPPPPAQPSSAGNRPESGPAPVGMMEQPKTAGRAGIEGIPMDMTSSGGSRADQGGAPQSAGEAQPDGVAAGGSPTPEYVVALVDACAAECQKDIDCNGDNALFATVDACRDASCVFLDDVDRSPASQMCVMQYVSFYQCLVDASCDEYNEYWSHEVFDDYPCIDEETAAQTACDPFDEGPIQFE